MNKNPRTPEQYRCSLFGPADLPRFAAYQEMVERDAYYARQTLKLSTRLNTLLSLAEAARQRFFRSLSDEDYLAMVDAVAAHAREAAARPPQFDYNLRSTFVPAAHANDFPHAAIDLAAIVEFMIERLKSEADRVRPMERQRLAEGDVALADFGAREETASLDERSPVLRDLIRTIEQMRKLLRELENGGATFRGVGFHAAPIIAAIKAQTILDNSVRPVQGSATARQVDSLAAA